VAYNKSMDESELQKKGVSIHAGFPNAAGGSYGKILDLNKLLVPHPSATFLMELDSNEWKDKGMFAGDIIVVDRALEPNKNDLVIWWEGEDFIFGQKKNIPQDTPVWGVVSNVIHRMKK
jgi:DNA polymerase V